MAKTKNTRSAAFATRAEVDAAIEALTPADEIRIKKVAQYYIRGMGGLARTTSFEDLHHEAVAAICIGAENPNTGRHWPKDEVSFLVFFVRTMESIVSHWAEDAAHEDLDSETVVETEDKETISRLSQTPDPTPLPDRQIVALNEVTTIVKLFNEDGEAWVVLEAWRLGMKGPEIMREYGFSEKTYEATCKRIRYRVRA